MGFYVLVPDNCLSIYCPTERNAESSRNLGEEAKMKTAEWLERVPIYGKCYTCDRLNQYLNTYGEYSSTSKA